MTEDRKHQGLLLNLSIKDNINITNLENFVLNQNQLKRECTEHLSKDINIKVSNIENPVASLSGGNQQKVVLAKWLNKDSQLYIFDEPTKGD